MHDTTAIKTCLIFGSPCHPPPLQSASQLVYGPVSKCLIHRTSLMALHVSGIMWSRAWGETNVENFISSSDLPVAKYLVVMANRCSTDKAFTISLSYFWCVVQLCPTENWIYCHSSKSRSPNHFHDFHVSLSIVSCQNTLQSIVTNFLVHTCILLFFTLLCSCDRHS